MKKWLFNPFQYIAGARSLLIGSIILAASASICYFSKIHFNGVVGSQKSDATTPLYFYFLEGLIDWACISLLLYFSGLIFSRSSIRLVDVFGTQAVARWPMVIAAIIGFGIAVPPGINNMLPKDLVNMITPSMIALTLLTLVCIIWMVALMYHAFTVSCNLKGGKATGIFIAAIIIAQIVSSILIHSIYNHLI